MMKRLNVILISLGIVAVILPRMSRAESKKGKIFTLEEIVVTATKTEKKVEDAPGSVTVVFRQELEQRNIKTVDDALSELKGVFVKRNKGLMDATTSVRMRGFKGDQYTLILLDGQPLNDAYTGGLDWSTLPVENIERIEVIRGAASALYGGNAMGGVINIITKTPKKLEAGATGGYGSHNFQRYRLSVGDRFLDKLSLRLGYAAESTDGYAATPVVRTISPGSGNVSGGYPMDDKYGNSTRWVVGDKGKNGARKSSIDAKATFDYSDTGTLSFTAVSGRHEYDYGHPDTYMGTFGDNSTYAIAGPGRRARFRPNDFISYTGIGRNETGIYTLALKEWFGDINLHAQLGMTRGDDRYTLESGGASLAYEDSPGDLKITKNEAWFSELRADVPIGDSHLLTLGASLRTDDSDTNDYKIPFYRSYADKGESTFYSGGNDRTRAVFLQDEWTIAKTLSLYLGGRYDTSKVYNGASGVPGAETRYESHTSCEFSPKASVVWKPFTGTTLRGSAGHAFRAPNLYELYRTWESWGWTYKSNPSLNPETVWAYEMGVDQYLFSRKTHLSLTGYRNDTKDLIYYKVDHAARTKTRMNAGKARTYGLEFGASQKIARWLTAWGNFTYTSAKIIDNPLDPSSEDKRVTCIPRTMYNIGLDAQHEWFKGSIAGRYYSKIYNDSDNKDKAEGVYGTYEPAFCVDGKISISPWKWGDISLSVNNIFDRKYYEYYRGDGRTYFCGLTIRY